MRTANGRDPTVTGPGKRLSWIGLSIAMLVLDTHTPASEPVGQCWKSLLTRAGVEDGDADIICAVRYALLHG